MNKTLQAISADIKRAFGSVGFFIAVFGVYIIYYAGAKSELRYAKDILLPFKYSIEASGFNKLITLCCVLPYTTSFCSDWNSKYIRSIVIRIGPDRYALSKVTACAFSSGIAMVLGILLFIVPLTARIPLVSITEGNFQAFATQTLGGALLFKGHYAAYFAIYIYLAFLSGAFWSVVGLCASAYIPNKFVALFIPFIGLYIISFITIGLPKWLQIDKVSEGLFMLNGTFISLVYVTLFFATLVFGVGLLFLRITRRRLANE